MSKGTLTGLLDVALDLAKEALGVTLLQAKLDACSDACKLSEDAEPLKPGDPAWSHAYEDVADLRRDWLREVGISNQQSAEMTRLGRELARANNEVGRLSKCAAEHEKKSNDRRLELVAIAQALGCPVVKEKMLERIAELKGGEVPVQAFTVKTLPPGQVFETSSDGGKTWYECHLGNSYRSNWLTRTRVVDPFKAFDMTPGEYAKALDADDKASAPMWGDWSNESRQQGIDGPAVSFWLRTSTSGGIAYAAPRQWGAIGGYRGDAKDIDDARKKADAHLVSIGELEAESAFDRLGDWDEFVDGVWVRSSTRNAIRVNRVGGWEVFAVLGGRPVLIAAGQETCDDGKVAVDALLVQHGLLDPSRAFKVQRGGDLAPLSDEEIVARHGKHSLAVPFVDLGKESAK